PFCRSVTFVTSGRRARSPRAWFHAFALGTTDTTSGSSRRAATSRRRLRTEEDTREHPLVLGSGASVPRGRVLDGLHGARHQEGSPVRRLQLVGDGARTGRAAERVARGVAAEVGAQGRAEDLDPPEYSVRPRVHRMRGERAREAALDEDEGLH